MTGVRVVMIGLCLSLFAGTTAAQSRAVPQEVHKILGISVEGNALADPAAIIANAGLKVGDEITVPGDQVNQAMKRLWGLHLFSDVRIAVDRAVADGFYLVVVVKELPRYERVEITGRDEVSEDDITKKISLVKGQVFPPQEALRVRNEVLKLYEKEGYLLANVDVKTTVVDSVRNRVVLHIDIDEGPEVQVDRIEFDGNVLLSSGDLRGAMDETSEKHWWKFWSSAKFQPKKYEEDKKKIVDYYRKHGFRDAEILSDSLSYADNKKNMTIHIRVKEGPQYHVRSIAWQGNTVFPTDMLNERLNVHPGEVFNQEKFDQNIRGNEAQTDVASAYLDNGYLRVNVEPAITRVGADSLDILVNVYEMSQFRIGHVNIKGNTKTQEKVIRRELYTRPGEYFSRAAVIRSIRQLSMLNYFNPEKIKPEPQTVDDKTVDITYEVEEKSSDNINASVGYSGYYGMTGAVGLTINNFAISDPFQGGAGQIMNFEWQFGEAARFRTLSIGFTEPWLYGDPTLLGVSLFDTRQSYSFDLQQTGASIRIGRRFKWPDDLFRGDWILNLQVNNVIAGLGIYRPGKTTQMSLTQVISRNSIDNPIFPVTGSSVSLSAQLSGGPLPGNVDYQKWLFSSEWYLPLFNSSRFALYFSSNYGFISPLSGGDGNISPIDMFFMGGTGMGYIATTPLRGYEDQSIGPRKGGSSATSSGGLAMTKQTMEFRASATMNPIPIYFLLFAEGGNVYEKISRADLFDLKRSAGFGARLQINPIGLIGFDYGYGFDDVYPKDGLPDGWHFHFVFGRNM
jgi:outer membrane protein insertion porin family